jgi:hypothetical protein
MLDGACVRRPTSLPFMPESILILAYTPVNHNRLIFDMLVNLLTDRLQSNPYIDDTCIISQTTCTPLIPPTFRR